MIDVLIQGRLHAAPQQRTSKAGKPYCTARLIAAARICRTAASSSITSTCIAKSFPRHCCPFPHPWPAPAN